MNSDKEKLQGAIITGATLLSAFVTRKLIEKAWVQITHKDPPKNPASRDTSWKQAFAWTITTSVLIGIAKLLVRRNVTLGSEEVLEN